MINLEAVNGRMKNEEWKMNNRLADCSLAYARFFIFNYSFLIKKLKSIIV